MYAKLINGCLRHPPKTVTWQGHQVNNPSEDKLADLGYKLVVYTDAPEAPEGKHYESSWTETEESITQTWTLVEDPVYQPEPDRLAELEAQQERTDAALQELILMMG